MKPLMLPMQHFLYTVCLGIALLQFGCASVEDQLPKQSKALRLTQSGRLDEAKRVLSGADGASEEPLARLQAEAKIAAYTGDVLLASAKVQEGLSRVSRTEMSTAPSWERRSSWVVTGLEAVLMGVSHNRLDDADLAALQQIARHSSEPADVRFDARKLIYLDAMNSGRLQAARDNLLELISLADRLGWGLNSQGAQALELASEFYALTGETIRAGEFAAEAFRIHSRAGGARNHFALRAHIAGAEYLMALISEIRREESDDGSKTRSYLSQLQQMIEAIDASRKQLVSVHPELDFRIKVLKLGQQLVPELPWLGQLKKITIDGPWHAERASTHQEIETLVAATKGSGVKRHEATALLLLSISELALDQASAVRSAGSALALAREIYQPYDFRLLAFLNQARMAYLSGPTANTLKSELLKLTLESTDLIDLAFKDFFPGATFVEKTSFGTTAAIQWSTSLSAASGVLSETQEYESLLRIKGRVHQSLRSDYKAWRQTPSTAAASEKIRAYTSLVSDFAYAFDDGRTAWERVQQAFAWARLSGLTALWRDVSLRADTAQEGDVSIGAIQRAMALDEVVVDFMRIDVPGVGDEILAYVLGPTGKPQRVRVGSSQWVGPLADILRQSLQAADTDVGKKNFDETSVFLWQQHLVPIETAIEKVNPRAKTVYIVPTREFAAMPFAAIRTVQGKYWGEMYNIALLFSARDFLKPVTALTAPRGATVVGNVDYGRAHPVFGGVEEVNNGRPSGVRLAPLGQHELLGLSNLYEQQSTVEPVALLSGLFATEPELEAKSATARILHLQTHGFRVTPSSLARYLEGMEGQQVNSVSVSANAELPPLLSYGLGLADANSRNDVWSQKMSDGILTGAEVALWDLSNVRLAVLSSCDAAIGDFYSNEMMLGLAAAFDYAGVHSIIGTVTPVNDRATSRLMLSLHKHLFAGKSPAEALRLAAIEIRRQAVADVSLDMPKYWAPFVAFGVQRPIFTP